MLTRFVYVAFIVSVAVFHCDRSAAVEPARLRVMTFNIHAGYGTDGKLDLARIAKTIRESDPDLVALQELDRKTKRSRGRDLLAELAELTEMKSAFGKAIDFQGGEYGVGVLSRLEIVQSKVFRLPTSAGREQRVALEVLVRSPDLPKLVFVCTHFDHTSDSTDRLAQAKRLMQLFSKGPSTAIIAGDLNATPDSEPMTILKRHWKLADENNNPTIPSASPKKKIDYVLYEDNAWELGSVNVMLERANSSDHLPVCAELLVRPK